MKKSTLVLFGIILLAAACAPNAEEFAPVEGAKAPHFELTSLEGKTVSLEDYRGRVVLINFWAIWCAPCRFEMPAIQDRFENTELEVLAINFDESEALVRPYVEELGLTFTILMDPGGSTQQLYQVRGYPSTYLVDEDGVIQIVHIGFMDEAQLDGYLEEMGIAN